MPTPADEVSVLIDGNAHSDWESYDIDSDLIIPADAFHMTFGEADSLPSFLKPWAKAEVKVGKQTVLLGRVDQVDETVAKRSHSLTISGRDYAGILVDCAAPIFTTRQATLEEVVAKVVRPLGLKNIRIDASNATTREKISVEPGDRAWDVLKNAAEANGLWPWFEPDGTLVIGGPNYTTPPVALLVMRKDGTGNMQSLTRSDSINERYSELTVLGQTHGTENANGQHALKGKAKDDAANFYRPQLVIDHEVDNAGMAQTRVRKLLADSMLSALSITVLVQGHHTSNGILWTPGQRVSIESEPHNINGVFFLMGRRFSKSREAGTTTELRFVQDKLWVLDAHPSKRKHRRGKNAIGAGAVVDLG